MKCAADVVHLAAAVESRLTRGTLMNHNSSRSHCVAVLKLTVLEGGAVRESRLQFFDLMGSERFVGQNSAHDTSYHILKRPLPNTFCKREHILKRTYSVERTHILYLVPHSQTSVVQHIL